MTSKTVAPSAAWFGQPLVTGKAPVKKNLFEEVIHATGTLELAPVFPYLDNGAIVPCLSVSLGGKSTQRFQFFHDNVVLEVLLCLAEQHGALVISRPPRPGALEGATTPKGFRSHCVLLHLMLYSG